MAYKGGITCLKCIKNITSLIILEPETINALKILQNPTSFLDDVQLDHGILRKIRIVLHLHVSYILGGKLKSKRFIDSLFPLYGHELSHS